MQKTIETGSRVGTVVRVVRGCDNYGIRAGDYGVVVGYDSTATSELKHRVHFDHPRDIFMWVTDEWEVMGTPIVLEAVHPAPETGAPQPPKPLLEHRQVRDTVQVGDVFKHKHRAGYYQVFTRTANGYAFFLGIQAGTVTLPDPDERYLDVAPYRDVIEREEWEYLPNARLSVFGDGAVE